MKIKKKVERRKEDRLEDYHKKANIPIDNDKRTSIVIQNPSLTSESLLSSNNKFCCI